MSNADQLEVFARVVLALALGLAVGLQREFRGHEAGIRTMGLIAFGAAVFTEAGRFSGELRIPAYVVQGVAIIGAGIIFRGRSGVHGITTAVTMFCVAGMGMLVAFELWLSAVLGTVLIIVVLELEPVSDWVFRHGNPQRTRPRHTYETHDK